MGDRLICPVEGAFPRRFTIIICPKGKGGAIRRTVRFFSVSWYDPTAIQGLGTMPVPHNAGLLSSARDFIWKSQGIGAWNAGASSVPGMARLCTDLKKTAESIPHLSWRGTTPRVISVYEEMKAFFSTLFIEGGVGTGMEGVVCQLWDDVTFNGTATGTRYAVWGQMQFSLLGAVTEDDWFDLLGRGNVVGGGFMSRLNLVCTAGEYENVSKMDPPDFTALQEAFLPRIKLLADVPVCITPDEGASSVVAEWNKTLPEGSERMNVQVWRSALLLAWLRREDTITAKTAADAVRLGQCQVDTHAFYQVATTDNKVAKIQAAIIRVLTMKGPLSRRELQKATHAHRHGTELWNSALASGYPEIGKTPWKLG